VLVTGMVKFMQERGSFKWFTLKVKTFFWATNVGFGFQVINNVFLVISTDS
jgi:hypothetical protein